MLSPKQQAALTAWDDYARADALVKKLDMVWMFADGAQRERLGKADDAARAVLASAEDVLIDALLAPEATAPTEPAPPPPEPQRKSKATSPK